MFEKLLANFLNTHLGAVLEGIDDEDVRVGVLNGDVVVRKVKMKADALTVLLDEPSLAARSGFVDELRVRVPWRSLGKEPVRVTFSGVYIVGEIDPTGAPSKAETPEDRERKTRVKAAKAARRAVDAAEQAWLKWNPAVKVDTLETNDEDDSVERTNAAEKRKKGLAGIIDVVMANLIVEISKIHVRIEDTYGDTNIPCAMGFTLEGLSLSTVDENLAATFQVGGFAERLRKIVKLERMGAYADFGSKSMASSSPNGWPGVPQSKFVRHMSAVFDSPDAHDKSVTMPRSYIFGPIRGTAMYSRRGRNETDTMSPMHQIQVNMEPICINVRSTQLKVFWALNSRIKLSRVRHEYVHLRPRVAVTDNTHAWWKFAIESVKMHVQQVRQRRGINFSLSIDKMMKVCKARASYIPLYLEHLRAAPPPPECMVLHKSDQRNQHWPPKLKIGVSEEMDALEIDVPVQSIVLFRIMAHEEYRRTNGVSAAVTRERLRRYGNKLVIVGTVVKLAGGGMKNIVDAAKALTKPFQRTVGKKDSSELARIQKRASRVDTVSTDEWNDLADAVNLTERNESLVQDESARNNKQIGLSIPDIFVTMIDDELIGGEREIFKIAISRILFGKCMGGSMSEQRLLIQSITIAAPEGKLLDLNGDNVRVLPSGDEAHAVLWGDVAVDYVALQVQMVKGDPETREEILLNAKLKKSFVRFLREPLERVAATATRHKFTKSYIKSYILDDDTMDQSSTKALMQQTNSFKIGPRMKLDLNIHAPIFILPASAEGVNLCVDLGSATVKSVRPSSVGVPKDAREQHNAYLIQVRGLKIGFIEGSWDPDTIRANFNPDSLCLETNLVPFLHTTSMDLTFVQNLDHTSPHPNAALSIKVPDFAIDLSPARVCNVNRVIQSLNLSSDNEASAVAEEEKQKDLTALVVRILQRDEQDEFRWLAATISIQSNRFLVVNTIDGLNSRVVRIDVTDTTGASKLREDIRNKLALDDDDDVLVVGKVVQSLSDLVEALSSDEAVFISFAIGASPARSTVGVAKSWYNKFNEIARANSQVRFLSAASEDGSTASRNKLIVSKIKFRLKVSVDRMILLVMAPLRPHPTESQQAWDEEDISNERSLARCVLAKLDLKVARSSTMSDLSLGANSLIIYDSYASEAYGRDLIAARPREIRDDVEFVTVTVIVRNQLDPDYNGVTADVRIMLGDCYFDLRPSTLIGLISFFKFRLRPPTWRIVKTMPEFTPKVLVNDALVRKVSRRIECKFTSLQANMLYDHTLIEEAKLGTLRVEQVLWTTSISSPTRETYLSIGGIALATTKMQENGRWSLKPCSSDISNVLLLKNIVYDTGEESDGADTMLDIEIGALDLVLTPELKEVVMFCACINPLTLPAHMPLWIHPANLPRKGFIQKKSRLSLKVDSPTITIPGVNESAPVTVILPGNLEITKHFHTKSVAGNILAYQNTRINLIGTTVTTKSKLNVESKLMQKPMELAISILSRVDDGDCVINEIDQVYDIKVKPISMDISGPDARCVYACLSVFKNAKPRANAAINPLIWGKVPPKEAAIVKSFRLQSMQYTVSITSMQVSVFKLQGQSRPISMLRFHKIQLFAIKNINRREIIELDVTFQSMTMNDSSSDGSQILNAGSAKLPLLRLKLIDDAKQRQIRAKLEPVHLILRLAVFLDTIRIFTPGDLGGEVAAGAILPVDINCLNGRETSLIGDIALTQCSRLLADDFKSSFGSYALDGNGHTVYFVDDNDEIIRENSENVIEPSALPRIIVGHGSKLHFDNVKFACSQIALAKFIKMSDGASYSLGANVEFIDIDHSMGKHLLPVVVKKIKKDKVKNAEPRDRKKVKSLLIDIDASCFHFIIQGEHEADRLDVMFGIEGHLERDLALTTNISGKLHRFRTTDPMKPALLEPLSAVIEVVSNDELAQCTSSTTPVTLNVTPHRLAILGHFSKSVAQALAVAPLLQCGVFTCVWSGASEENDQAMSLLVKKKDSTSYTVWRPILRAGYASLADVVKSGQGAPDISVTIIRDSPTLCALPLKFEQVGDSDSPCFWQPIAPPGFVSLGIIVSSSPEDVPSLTAVRCIREELVTNSGRASSLVSFPLYGDMQQGSCRIWRLGNQVEGCRIVESDEQPDSLDIRSPAGFHIKRLRRKTAGKNIQTSMFKCITTVDFNRIWSGHNSDFSYIGFWMVDCPEGYVSTGDCIAFGELPPLSTRVFAADEKTFRHPIDFKLVYRATSIDMQDLSIWKPVPAEGFVAVGFVATTLCEHPRTDRIVCIRQDLVRKQSADPFELDDAMWKFCDGPQSDESIYFWETNPKTRTFAVASVVTSTSKDEPTYFDFGPDFGFMEPAESKTANLLGLKANLRIPSLTIALALERHSRNQVLLKLQLQDISLMCDARPNVMRLAVDTVLTLVHRNRRVNNALEPVIEPWNFSLLLSNVSHDELASRPTGTYFTATSQERLKLLVTQALLYDVVGAIALMHQSDNEKCSVARSAKMKSVPKEEVFNSTGRTIWVRTPHGSIEEVAPGQRIGAKVNDDDGFEAISLSPEPAKPPGRSEDALVLIDEVNLRNGDENLAIAHIILDILAIGELAHTLLYPKLSFSVWDEDSKTLDVAHLPIGKFHGTVSLSIPHPLLQRPGDRKYVHNRDLQIKVDFSYVHANGESVTMAGIYRASIHEQRNGWIGTKLGCWISCDTGDGDPMQVKVRAHVVEGLASHPIAESSIQSSKTIKPVLEPSSSFGQTLPPLVVCRTNDLKQTWCSKGPHIAKDALSVWTPCAPSKYELETRYEFFCDKQEDEYRLVPFGSVLVGGLVAPQSALMAVVTPVTENQLSATAFPDDFELIWKSDCSTLSFWKPLAPDGYVAIGNVAVDSTTKPSLESFVCIREDLTETAGVTPAPIWRAHRNFKPQNRRNACIYRTGMQSTGGWTYVHQKYKRDKSGQPINNMPPARQLSQKLCKQLFDDEGVHEMRVGLTAYTGIAKHVVSASDQTFAISFSPSGPFDEIVLQRKATHVVPHKTHSMVFDSRKGRLKGFITCINETPANITAVVEMASRAGASQTMSGALSESLYKSDDKDNKEVAVYEAERYYPFTGWSSPKDLNIFSGKFSTHLSGSSSTKCFPDVKPPKGYAFAGPWTLDVLANDRTTSNGWAYGGIFVTTWPPPRGSAVRKGRATRRRRWFRKLEVLQDQDEDVQRRVSLRHMRKDTLDDWRGELAADGELQLPALSGADAYTLSLNIQERHESRVEQELMLSEKPQLFHLNWLMDKWDRAWAYNSGRSYFILVKERIQSAAQIAGGNQTVGLKLRVLAPLQIQSSSHCLSQFIVSTDGEEKALENMKPGDTKYVTSVDTSRSIAFHLTVFSEHVVLMHGKPSILNITAAGQPAATQCTWLNVKGYPHLRSLFYISASRTRAIGAADASHDHPTQHPVNVEYRAALLITNATPFTLRTIAWSSEDNCPDTNADNYVAIAPGQTQPGTLHMTNKMQNLMRSRYVVAVSINSGLVTTKVSASAEITTIFVPIANGEKIALRCSCSMWSTGGGNLSTSMSPTVHVTIQPAISAVNLTNVPLLIRSTKMSDQLLKPGAHATSLPIEFGSIPGDEDVEDALNRAIFQLAVAPSALHNTRAAKWSAPVGNIVQSSGSWWSVPSALKPSIREIGISRKIRNTISDEEPISAVKPIILQFRIDRLVNGCFIILFTGVDGAASDASPVSIVNHMREGVVVRQVKEVTVSEPPSKRRASIKSTQTSIVSVGPSFVLEGCSAMSWAWSSPSQGSKEELDEDKLDGSVFQKEKWLEISNTDGDKMIVRVEAAEAHGSDVVNLGSIHMGSHPHSSTAMIFGVWSAETLQISIVAYPDALASSVSDTLMRVHQKPTMTIPKELHVSLDFMGLSMTVVDRSQQSFTELFHMSIDDIILRRGSNLCLGRSIYTHLTIGALQVDYSSHDARYPVFVWHDSSQDNFLECYFTLTWKASGEVLVNCYHQKTPEGGIFVLATEDLVWHLQRFHKSLQLERLRQGSSVAELGSRSSSVKNKQVANKVRKQLKGRDLTLQVLSLAIEPVSITVTFEPLPESRPADADAKMISVLSFANVERLSISVQRFCRYAQQISLSDLRREFKAHLVSEMVSQTFTMLTSMDTLGNMSTGLSALGRALETGFGALESMPVRRGDDESNPESDIPPVPKKRRHDAKAGNIAIGLFYGTEKLGRGIVFGITGLFTRPYKGYKKRGMKGAAYGIAQGLTGLIAKPIAGVIGFVAKTVEGLASTAKIVKIGAREVMNDKFSSISIRRLPIAIRADGILREWNLKDAVAVHHMRTAVRVGKSSMSRHCPGAKDRYINIHDVHGGKKVIVSAERVMYIQISDEKGPEYMWHVSWSDVASVWIEDATFVYIQTNIGLEGEKHSSAKDNAENGSRLRIHAGTVEKAKELSANLRRVWIDHIDAREREV